MRSLLIAFAAIALFALAQGKPLDVHIIAHSHDDVGWLKSVDDYFLTNVQYILDSVVRALSDNPNRKFIYVEVAFFFRWWNEQTPAMKDVVRGLVRSGQLEFINGGWCMNDEANTYYEAMVDQMTLGHQFLLREFDVTPTISWHIDPFGHSSGQAMINADIGFNGFMFCRAQYQDKAKRLAAKELEMLWQPSASLGSKNQIYTLLTYAHYSPPPGFDFETGDPPINNDPAIFNVNIKERAELLVKYVDGMAGAFQTNHVLVTFGDDFQYQNAIVNFKNMDKIINYINANPQYNVNIRYSTPSIYLDAVHKENITLPLNTHDFFPYAGDSKHVWSGYFTSRPTLKYYIRVGNAVLQAAERLFTLASPGTFDATGLSQLDTLRQAMGVMQHHDAVTGTSIQWVCDDDSMRISIGQTAATNLIHKNIGSLLAKNSQVSPPAFTACLLLNESICPATNELSPSSNLALPIVIYNPLSWERIGHVMIPIPKINAFVTSENSSKIPSQIINYPGQSFLAFDVNTLPAVGLSTVFVQSSSNEIDPPKPRNSNANIILTGKYLQVETDPDGELLSITNTVSKLTVTVSHMYGYYRPDNDSNAYYFGTVGSSYHMLVSSKPVVTVTTGPIVNEIHRVWGAENVTQIIRLWTSAEFLEFEARMPPIDLKPDQNGREIFSRFTTNLKTQATFYTDSNGLEMQKRIRNFQPTYNLDWQDQPVAWNYYPMNSVGFIRDESTNTQFTILPDRSRGCASLIDGQIESMLHRRLGRDLLLGPDASPINTIERIMVHPTNKAPYREKQLHVAHPVSLSFGKGTALQTWNSQFVTSKSLIGALPKNVQLMSLNTQLNGTVILRLHHVYSVGEDKDLSVPVQVDLQKLFGTINIESIAETTLTANKLKANFVPWKWQSKTTLADSVVYPNNDIPKAAVYTLNPMETRTFIVKLLK